MEPTYFVAEMFMFHLWRVTDSIDQTVFSEADSSSSIQEIPCILGNSKRQPPIPVLSWIKPVCPLIPLNF
jgi:hypothetical protein